MRFVVYTHDDREINTNHGYTGAPERGSGLVYNSCSTRLCCDSVLDAAFPHMNRELLSRENGIPNAGNIRVSNVRTFPAQVYGAIQRITYVAKYATLIAYCGETMGRSTTVLLRLGISYLVSTSAQEDERGLKQFPNDTCLRSG